MTAPPPVMLAQLQPGPSLPANLDAIEALADRAAEQGAGWLLLPEYACFLHGSRAAMEESAAASGVATERLRRLAADRGLWLLVGSLAVPGSDGRMANRCLLLDARGETVAQYDKLHLYDALLPGGREIRESRGYSAGDQAVVADTPWGRVGLSICYDLRFPHLYRALALAGADVVVVPAAFTRATGTAHWRPLLTARAIECGAYVLAPATCGDSPGGRVSHGHAMVVDPWGRVVAELADAPGELLLSIDPARVAEARLQLPTLSHDRPFAVRVASCSEPLFHWSPPAYVKHS